MKRATGIERGLSAARARGLREGLRLRLREGIPPGQYRVVAWHERFGEKTVDITFLPGEARDLIFSFDAREH